MGHYIFKFSHVCYTCSSPQFRLVIFQVLSKLHMAWAPILDDSCRHEMKLGSGIPSPGTVCSRMEADQRGTTFSLSVFLSLALPPSCSRWQFPATSVSASRVSRMKGLESTEENTGGPWCTHRGQGRAAAAQSGALPAGRRRVYTPCVSEALQHRSPGLQRAPCSYSHWLKLRFLHNNHTRDGTFLSSRMFCKDCQMESVSWIIIKIFIPQFFYCGRMHMT